MLPGAELPRARGHDRQKLEVPRMVSRRSSIFSLLGIPSETMGGGCRETFIFAVVREGKKKYASSLPFNRNRLFFPFYRLSLALLTSRGSIFSRRRFVEGAFCEIKSEKFSIVWKKKEEGNETKRDINQFVASKEPLPL